MKNEIEQRTKYPYHTYPLIQMNGLHTQLLEFMTDIHPIKDEKDAEYYLSRLEKIPEVFSQILEKMEKSKELKIFQYREVKNFFFSDYFELQPMSVY